ncbi:MAG: Flp1 family type IVb pilin [Bacillota bacterium]|nr:Flp1 family type IVb pilin [Bacillota bacterium]
MRRAYVKAMGILDFRSKKGMEMVQVAILVAIAIALGLIFRSEITDFVNSTFQSLDTEF